VVIVTLVPIGVAANPDDVGVGGEQRVKFHRLVVVGYGLIVGTLLTIGNTTAQIGGSEVEAVLTTSHSNDARAAANRTVGVGGLIAVVPVVSPSC
jgi:hypothetical protein